MLPPTSMPTEPLLPSPQNDNPRRFVLPTDAQGVIGHMPVRRPQTNKPQENQADLLQDARYQMPCVCSQGHRKLGALGEELPQVRPRMLDTQPLTGCQVNLKSTDLGRIQAKTLQAGQGYICWKVIVT